MVAVAYVGGCCHPPLADFSVPRAAGPGPSCAREYGKDQYVMRSPARQENYNTPPLQMASAGFWKFSAPEDREEDYESRRTAIYGL